MKRLLIAATAAALLAPAYAKAQEKENWTDKVTVKGDMRLREENIDQEGKEGRNRLRLRARLEAKGVVNDTVEANVRLATGGKDPVSSNQTFSEGFSRKEFGLDRAYIKWTPAEGPAALLGGKMGVPFYKPGNNEGDLIWDSDLNLEGAALQANLDPVVVNLGGFSAQENATGDDIMLYGAQALANVSVSEGAKLTAGVGYFAWDQIQGQTPLYDPAKAFGNSTVAATNGALSYVNEYGDAEAFVEFATKVGGMPVSVFGDYVVNVDAESPGDTGYLVGLLLGKAKDAGSFEFGYDYRQLEADAVVGAFTDSDSFGGGTNGEGHRFKGAYAINKNWTAGGALFLNKIDPDGKDVDYTRVQIDLSAKF